MLFFQSTQFSIRLKHTKEMKGPSEVGEYQFFLFSWFFLIEAIIKHCSFVSRKSCQYGS